MHSTITAARNLMQENLINIDCCAIEDPLFYIATRQLTGACITR